LSGSAAHSAHVVSRPGKATFANCGKLLSGPARNAFSDAPRCSSRPLASSLARTQYQQAASYPALVLGKKYLSGAE